MNRAVQNIDLAQSSPLLEMVFELASQRCQQLLQVAKGASAVTENEFKLFQKAMSEQGLSHSSTAEIIAKASAKKQLDAWGYVSAVLRYALTHKTRPLCLVRLTCRVALCPAPLSAGSCLLGSR